MTTLKFLIKFQERWMVKHQQTNNSKKGWEEYKLVFIPDRDLQTFNESLILAQDERWRRA